MVYDIVITPWPVVLKNSPRKIYKEFKMCTRIVTETWNADYMYMYLLVLIMPAVLIVVNKKNMKYILRQCHFVLIKKKRKRKSSLHSLHKEKYLKKKTTEILNLKQ